MVYAVDAVITSTPSITEFLAKVVIKSAINFEGGSSVRLGVPKQRLNSQLRGR